MKAVPKSDVIILVFLQMKNTELQALLNTVKNCPNPAPFYEGNTKKFSYIFRLCQKVYYPLWYMIKVHKDVPKKTGLLFTPICKEIPHALRVGNGKLKALGKKSESASAPTPTIRGYYNTINIVV